MTSAEDARQLRERTDRLGAALTRRIARVENATFVIRVMLVIGGGLLATVGSLLDAPVAGQTNWKMILGLGGALAATAGGVLIAFVERGSPSELNEAREATNLAQRFLSDRERIKSQIADMRGLDRRRRQLIAAQASMKEVAEHALCNGRRDTVALLNDLFDVSERALIHSMGYEGGERHSISICQARDGTGGKELREIFDRRSERVMERTVDRVWRPGESFTGAAYQRNAEVVVADTTSDLVRSAFHFPPNTAEAENSVPHRSLVAQPVRIAGWDEPWGVLTVTSDQAGRFSPDPNANGSFNVEAVRTLAGMVALLVACSQTGRTEGLEDG